MEDADGVSVEDAGGTHDRRDWDCRLTIPEFTKAVAFPLDRKAHKATTCRTNSDLDCMLDVPYTRSMNEPFRCLIRYCRCDIKTATTIKSLFFHLTSQGELSE